MHKSLKLLVLLILLSVFARGQNGYPNTIQLKTGYSYLDILKTLGVPNDTFEIPAQVVNHPHIALKGSTLYRWDTSGKVWTAAASPSSLANIGAGYRIGVPGTSNVKTLFAGFGIKRDSTSNSNALTDRADTTRFTGLPTFFVVDSMLKAGVKFYNFTQYGGVSDAKVYQTSTIFGTNNTTAANNILNLASNTNPIVFVADGEFSVDGLNVGPNTQIWVPLQHWGFILRNGANRPLIRNRNISFNPAARLDSNIVIDGGTWNGNYAGQTELGNPTHGLVTAMTFAGVYGLTIKNTNITDRKTYAIAAWNNKQYRVIDNNIDYTFGPNTDGVHADGNCEDVWIERNTIRCGDDGIALNADDNYTNLPSHYTYPYYVNSQGPVKNVVIRGNLFRGGVGGLRFLSTVSRMDNILVDDTKGEVTLKGIETDLAGMNNGIGNIGSLTVTNWNLKVTTTGDEKGIFNIACRIENLSFIGIRRDLFSSNAPTVKFEQGANIKNFLFDGYVANDTSGINNINHIDVADGGIFSMKVTNPTVKSKTLVSGSNLIKVNGGGVRRLILNGVETDNIEHGVHFRSGNLKYISASNITHTGVQADSLGFVLVDTSKTVYDYVLSTYYGVNPLQVRGGGEVLKTRGDGFMDPADTIPDETNNYAHLNFPDSLQYEGAVQTNGALIDSSHYWKALSTNGAYGHKGRSSSFITGEQDGAIVMFANANSVHAGGGGVILGFTADEGEPFPHAGFDFLGGQVRAYDGLLSPSNVEAVTLNYWYKLERIGVKFYLSKSATLTGAYTLLKTYTIEWGGKLWAMLNVAGENNPADGALYRGNLPMSTGFTTK